MHKMFCGVLLASAAWPLCLAAQIKPTPPAYQELRWDEDWSYLRDSALQSDSFDPIKYIRDGASGDRNPNGQTLGTFNPLFPTTAYSGRIGLIGASNVIDVTPNFRFRLSRRVYFVPECSFFWRESVHDGIHPAGRSRILRTL
jgi:Alginate export